jgi:hypothetical protein
VSERREGGSCSRLPFSLLSYAFSFFLPLLYRECALDNVKEVRLLSAGREEWAEAVWAGEMGLVDGAIVVRDLKRGRAGCTATESACKLANENPGI